jgi:hypothetical protein
VIRVDGAEIELAGDQEDDGPDGGHSGEAAGAALPYRKVNSKLTAESPAPASSRTM